GPHHMKVGERTIEPVVELLVGSENLRILFMRAFECTRRFVHRRLVAHRFDFRFFVYALCLLLGELTTNSGKVAGRLSRLEIGGEFSLRVSQLLRRRIEMEPSETNLVIESLISKHDSGVLHLRGERTASLLAA